LIVKRNLIAVIAAITVRVHANANRIAEAQQDRPHLSRNRPA
jgi:hypothetical protein